MAEQTGLTPEKIQELAKQAASRPPATSAKAAPTYQESRLEAEKLLVELGYTKTFDAGVGLKDNYKFKHLIEKFSQENNMAPDTDMGKLVEKMQEKVNESKIQPPSFKATDRGVDKAMPASTTPTAPAVAANPVFDPQVQKAQGYMRMLGITDVEAGGQKKRLVVDGINGTNTQTALTKYNTDNGLAKDASMEDSIRHMEESLKKNGPELQQRMNKVMEQGTDALRSDVRGMQLTMNLLKSETLKVDGINGIMTTAAYNQYSGKNYAVPTAPIAAAAATSADPLGDFIQERGLDKTPSAPAPAARTPQQNASAGTHQIRTEAVPPTVNVENAAGYERPQQQRHEQRYEQRPSQQQRYETTRQNPGYNARDSYNNASGVADLEKTLMRRNDLRSQGYGDAVAKQLVNDHRMDELLRGGMDERAAKTKVNAESRLADLQERGQRGEGQDMQRIIRQMDQQERREAAQTRGTVRQVGQDAGTMIYNGTIFADGSRTVATGGRQAATGLGQVFGEVMGSGPSNPRQVGNAVGTVAGGIAGMAGGTSRDSAAIRQGVGGAVSLGMGVGKLLGLDKIFSSDREQPDMRVIEYQRPTTYSNRLQGSSWEDRTVAPVYQEASSRGMTPADRAQMDYDQAMQRQQQQQQQQPAYNRGPNNSYTGG